MYIKSQEGIIGTIRDYHPFAINRPPPVLLFSPPPVDRSPPRLVRCHHSPHSSLLNPLTSLIAEIGDSPWNRSRERVRQLGFLGALDRASRGFGKVHILVGFLIRRLGEFGLMRIVRGMQRLVCGKELEHKDSFVWGIAVGSAKVRTRYKGIREAVNL
uniref:Uncharacterized protein n=1 Tax=Musa acuminata subsp. malaccensis TaxID=214687 RepID=A0A804KWN2_MUSAM